MGMQRGLSRIEVPVTAATVATVFVTLLCAGLGMAPPVLDEAALAARRAKDASGLQHLHQVLVADAADRANSKGAFMLPGLINRLPIEGVNYQGTGEPDESLNNHANLFSAMIARQLVPPEILVSPAEVNPVVKARTDYEWSKYRPASDSYWDDGMRCDLATGSNVSYATMPLDASRRRSAQWRSGGDSRFAVIGNRGPRGGAQSGKDFSESKSLLLFGSPTEWAGHTCYGDNHVDFGRSLLPDQLRPVGTATPPVHDSLFGNESFALEGAQRNSDSWLVMQILAAGTAQRPGTTIDVADGGRYVSWD